MASTSLNFFFNLLPGLKLVYRRFESVVIATRKRKNQKTFLSRCLEEQVVPTTFGFHKFNNILGKSFPTYIRDFLKDRIKISSIECDRDYFQLRSISRDLKFMCPNQAIYNCITQFAFRKANYVSEQHKRSLDQKLENLCNNSVWKKFSLTDNVVNESDVPLNSYELELLGLGLNFALHPMKNNAMDYIVGFDKFMASHNYNSEFSCIKGVLLQGILDCLENYSGLPKRYQLAMTSLKKRDNIIITKADKGGKVVILNRETYLEKAYSLLNDNETYEKLTKNPLKNVAADFNKTVRNIGRNKDDIKLLEQFKVINPSLQYFYGLPKIHKEGVPLRPIISNVGSFSCKLAKWLSSLLSPFVGKFSSSNIKHSQDFVDKIKHLNCNNFKMLSLDIVSLFTNVPVDDVLAFLENKLVDFQDEFPLQVSKIIALVKLCVTNNVFSFDNKFYRQRNGCSMGSSLSPVLASLYMEYFESCILPQIIPPGMCWYRYVDDIFTVWNDDWGSFETFFQKLNDLVPNIKFKVEWEVDGKLPFLDVLVIRDNGKLSFSVYRKPTHSGSYLHYFSNHSVQVKRSMASGLFLRALRICSPQYLDQELNCIKKQLSKLAYPDWFLDKSLSVAKSNFYGLNNSDSSYNETNTQKVLKVPYNSSTDSIMKKLPKEKIKVICNYPNKLFNNVVNVHQKEKCVVNQGVYKIPCNDCGLVYIGQTGRDLKSRVCEHKNSVRYAQNSSAVFNHVSTLGHNIGWNNAEILYKSSCSYKRKIIESALINVIPNFNLSRGQWPPDPITSTVVGKVLSEGLTKPDGLTHVT